MSKKDEIRTEAWKRMRAMEHAYGSSVRLPGYILSYYRLRLLIYEADFGAYFRSYGWLPVEPSDVGDARAEFGWENGTVGTFEREVCLLLSEKCQQLECGTEVKSFR